MIQLRYLEESTLSKATRSIQANGAWVENYVDIDTWLVQRQEITDEASASIYGARINRMLRLSSPRHDLERHLGTLMNASSDNISKYTILYRGARYQIAGVRSGWVDVELI